MKRQIVERIKKILKDYNITKAVLFGSFARGEEKKGSDIDIIIQPPKQFTLFDMVEVKERLERALNKKVDIITFNSINKFIKPYIEKDMKVII